MSGARFRLDPLTREWVTVAGNRQQRPNRPVDSCPFCVGGLEAPDPYETRAFPNRWPSLAPGDPTDAPQLAEAAGTLVSTAARGACEVVLYAPEHDASLGSLGAAGVRKVIDLWAERTAELLARPEVEYVLVFENRGADAGATIPHPHGQIYAFPFVPPVPAREAEIAQQHGCPVCAQVDQELGAGERVVLRQGSWTAYVPYASAWPYGTILAPDEHVEGLPQLPDASRDDLAAVLAGVLQGYDRLFDRPFPYMLWIHHGVHLHVHIATPWRSADTMRYVAAGEVGSGMYFNPVEPESAAAQLRQAVHPR